MTLPALTGLLNSLDQYSYALMTFNTDPGVAPAVPLPASGMALAGGMLALTGLRRYRQR